MLATPSAMNPPHHDTQAALARYSQALHQYTQQLWQEARRKAELRAQNEGRSSKSKHTRGSRQPSPSQATMTR